MREKGWWLETLDVTQLHRCFHCSYFVPRLELALKSGTIFPCVQAMPSRLEMSGDGTKGGKKTLGVAYRFEAPHFPLTQSRRLVGILCPIVEPFVLPMLHAGKHLLLRRPITGQFVGDNHARDVFKSFEEFPKEFLRRLFVASALHQDIKHVAMLIHRPPQIVSTTSSRCHLSPQ
jgi:hypothetical protein